VDDASGHSKVLLPADYLREHNISTDEFLERFVSQQNWSLDEPVIGSGTVVILAMGGGDRSRAVAREKLYTVRYICCWRLAQGRRRLCRALERLLPGLYQRAVLEWPFPRSKADPFTCSASRFRKVDNR
jgi:hypothetical protein